MEDHEYGEWIKKAVMASKDYGKKRLLEEKTNNQQTKVLSKNTKHKQTNSVKTKINVYDIVADTFSAFPKKQDEFKRIKLEETAYASWGKSCVELYQKIDNKAKEKKKENKVIGVKQESKVIINKVNTVTVKQQPSLTVIKQGSLMITDIDLLIDMLENSNGDQNKKKRGRKCAVSKDMADEVIKPAYRIIDLVSDDEDENEYDEDYKQLAKEMAMMALNQTLDKKLILSELANKIIAQNRPKSVVEFRDNLNNYDLVVCTNFRESRVTRQIHYTKSCLYRLCTDNMMSETLVDGLLSYQMSFLSDEITQDVLVLPVMFYGWISKGMTLTVADNSSVVGFMRKYDIFKYKTVAFAISGVTHFSGCVLTNLHLLQNKLDGVTDNDILPVALHGDSLCDMHQYRNVFEVIKSFLLQEYSNKKSKWYLKRKKNQEEFDNTMRNLNNLSMSSLPASRQKGGINCGLFATKMIVKLIVVAADKSFFTKYRISQNFRLEKDSFSVSETEVRHLRRDMYHQMYDLAKIEYDNDEIRFTTVNFRRPNYKIRLESSDESAVKVIKHTLFQLQGKEVDDF